MVRDSIREACEKAWQASDLSSCKPLGFDVLGWIAILTALIGLAIFIVHKARKWAADSTETGKLRGWPWRSRFRAVCAAIRPIMDENGRIFREFGPNSGAGGPARIVRQNVGVWREMMPTIVENNARIRNLINSNRDAIPTRFSELFEKWGNHIDAFEAHVRDPLADYRDHQFPVEVVNVINENA